MNALSLVSSYDNGTVDETLFARIAADLNQQRYSICPVAFPDELANGLYLESQNDADEKYIHAGIGRGEQYLHNAFVRTDEIRWITVNTDAGEVWLAWTEALQRFLNQQLYLGLFSFESHFAYYRPGSYYKRHYDAFKGAGNRILSLVLYLNPSWGLDDGGELVLYRQEEDLEGIKVTPLMGTLVVFLSEEFPHEALPAHRDRHSIAGWFRVNGSIAGRIDPPR